MTKDKETKEEVEKVKQNNQADKVPNDAKILHGELVRLFNLYMSEVLDVLSSRFPHTKGDGSVNEGEFQGLRSKILRCGNNKIRFLPDTLDDYKILKTSQTTIEKIDINTPVEIRDKATAKEV